MSKLLKQRRGGKTSSKIRALADQVVEAPTPDGYLDALVTAGRLPRNEYYDFVLELEERLRPQNYRDILIEVANLHDEGCERFRHRGWFSVLYRRVPDSELLRLRDELRRVWHPETPQEDKQRILNEWMMKPPGWYQTSRGYSPILVSWHRQRVFPDPLNPRAAIALALLEHASHLAHCRNPECVAPYFLARRKNQKYCELGACTEYAQRQYALTWWNKKGKKRRAAKKQKGQATKNKSRSR